MDINRWEDFTKREQLLTIGAEFMRAKVWQGKSQQNFISALERALGLIDLTISDAKWRENILMLLRLREEVAKFYVLQRTDDVSMLYAAL